MVVMAEVLMSMLDSANLMRVGGINSDQVGCVGCSQARLVGAISLGRLSLC
jgi:hypothetical protein